MKQSAIVHCNIIDCNVHDMGLEYTFLNSCSFWRVKSERVTALDVNLKVT